MQLIEDRIGTIGYGARCYLATQQETVLASILDKFGDEFHAHLTGAARPAEPLLIAELLDIRGGRAVIDEHHRHKQPDWSYRARSSGSTPVELKRRYRQLPAR